MKSDKTVTAVVNIKGGIAPKKSFKDAILLFLIDLKCMAPVFTKCCYCNHVVTDST